MALKAMSSLQGYSNGSISNPSELASHVMPDKRTLIQTIYEDGYVMYNDGIHIVEVDDNALYVDLTGYGMRECQITKMEIDTDFEYHDEKILNKPEIKYQSKRTNTMETTIKSVSKAIKELVMLGEKNLVPFGNSIGIIDQDWINLDVMFKKILQEDEKNRNEAKKILSEPLNTKSEEIAQEKKIKELDKKFNAFIDGCAKELLQLCENEEKQIPIAVYNLKNVINSHLLSENGKFDKILKHIGDIKDESFVNKLVINKNIHASSIIYNELSEHVFTGIKTRTEAEHSLNNALNGYAYDIINTCKIKDISLYLRQTDFPASINADRKTYRIGGHDVVVSWNKNKVMINDTASKEAIADKALQRLKYLGKTDYSVQDNYGLASRKFKTQKDAFNAFAELSGSLQVMEYNRHKINGSSFSTNGHYEESLKWSADIRFTGNEVVDFASLSDADRNEIADILFEGDQHGTLSSIGVEWDANFDIEVIDKPGDYRYFELIPLNAVEEIAESIRNGNLSGEVEVSVIQLGPFFEEEIALDNLVDNRQEVASVVLDYLNYEQASVGDVIDVLGLTGKDDKVYDNVQEIMDRHGVEFSPIEKMIELGFQERDDMRWIIAEECSKELLEYKQSV
jgi:hypothetical protein